jgi:hypothetical protein
MNKLMIATAVAMLVLVVALRLTAQHYDHTHTTAAVASTIVKPVATSVRKASRPIRHSAPVVAATVAEEVPASSQTLQPEHLEAEMKLNKFGLTLRGAHQISLASKAR